MGARQRAAGDGAGSRPRGRVARLVRLCWRWGLRPLLLLVVLGLALFWGEKAVHAVRSASMSDADRLREDHARLERLLLLEHPAPFRNAERREVEAALGRAGEAIERHAAGRLSREGVLAHFFAAVASLRDPHTTMAGRYERFGILRVSFALFGDEVRLVAAPDQADLDARLVAVDGRPAGAVLDRIRPLVAHPNESGFLDGAPGVLRSPGLLRHAGVARQSTGVTLEVERADGGAGELVLPRLTLDEYRARRPVAYSFPPEEPPLYRREDRGAYWFEPLAGRGALYIRLASSWGFAEQAMAEFADRALAARARLGGGPIIVDARGNPGGNPHAHVPLVAALAASPQTRGPANLRLLVDRGTHSAAIVAGADLERRTGALVVGEEPGDNAHLTTDARPFTLRHSGAEIWVPTGLMHTPGGAGNRPRLTPARPVTPSFADWVAGRDPALEAALAPWPDPAPEATATEASAVVAAPTPPTGRFAFDPHRALTLERAGAGYRATVTGLGSDLLSRRADGVWTGGLHLGLRGDGGGRLERRLPGGSWTVLPPRPGEAPLELALDGRAEEAARAYAELTADGTDRQLVAELALTSEGVYRYREGAAEAGRTLMELARRLSPADPLIPLQHSLLRKEAEDRWVPPAGALLHAIAACGRRYAAAEVLNDWRLCL